MTKSKRKSKKLLSHKKRYSVTRSPLYRKRSNKKRRLLSKKKRSYRRTQRRDGYDLSCKTCQKGKDLNVSHKCTSCTKEILNSEPVKSPDRIVKEISDSKDSSDWIEILDSKDLITIQDLLLKHLKKEPVPEAVIINKQEGENLYLVKILYENNKKFFEFKQKGGFPTSSGTTSLLNWSKREVTEDYFQEKIDVNVNGSFEILDLKSWSA